MIDCFIPYINNEISQKACDSLSQSPNVREVILLVSEQEEPPTLGYRTLATNQPESTRTMRLISLMAKSEYILFCPQPTVFELGQNALLRFERIAELSKSNIVYADYYDNANGNVVKHPTIEYQLGSVRDDFNFGPLFLINAKALKAEIARNNESYFNSGWYRLRLSLSYPIRPYHLNELLYTVKNDDHSTRHFDYVDPRNRDLQMERERAFLAFLKSIGALLEPKFKNVNLEEYEFETEASIVIPVRNRVRTIGDAIQSALSQKTDFPFNIIVVDNHSSDGTSEIIQQYAKSNRQILHIIPDATDLGIGGCWKIGRAHV